MPQAAAPNPAVAERDALLLTLARKHLPGLETLDERGSDALDFHEAHVAGLRRMLVAAFAAGYEAAVAELAQAVDAAAEGS